MPNVDWRTLSKKSREEQQKFFEEHLQREPVTDFSSIRVGDHLVTQNKLYFHHFLCIGKSTDSRPEIIHYFGTPKRAVRSLGSVSLGKSFGLLGKISTMILPDAGFIKDQDDLIEKKVQRIIWPEWLCRFSVEHVIERAKRREGESDYDLLKNNCEHFIVWCMCDLNVSIQVTKTCLKFGSALYALLAGGIHLARQEGVQRLLTLFFKLIANFSDEAVDIGSLAWNPSDLSNTAIYAAYGVTCLIETGKALYGVWQANKKHKKGILIKSKQEFAASIAEIVAKSVCRAGLGIAGSVIGQAVIPLPLLGSLIGGGMGAILGHFIGVFIGWLTRKGIKLFDKSVTNSVPSEKHLIDDDDDDNEENDDNNDDDWEIIEVEDFVLV